MAQLRDLIVNGPSRFLGVSTYNEDVLLNKGAIAYDVIIPGETLTYNLGTADNAWLNIYGANLRASTAVIVTGSAEATAASSGAIQVTGGIYVAKKSLFGSDIYLGSTSYYLNGTTSKLNGLTTASTITSGGNVVPSETNKKNLGTSSLRWANLYIVNGNASGSLSVSGTVTSTGGFIGNLTGNVIGNVTGDVTGNLTGVADKANRLTKSGGSTDRPVYFTTDGIPQPTTYRMAGTNVTATTGIAIGSATNTGIWYVNDTSGILGISDGVAIVNKYNDSWITQIYQDYRTGQLAVRGKNNGTWQDWRVILDEDNFTNYLDGYYNGKYVLKTGDTMSGPLVVQTSENKLTIDTGGSITTEVTKSGGWARYIDWKQKNTSNDTASVKAEMGAYGAGGTLNYWYVGTGWEEENTWLQVNAAGTTIKGTLNAKGHVYLTGSHASSSTGNTTQLVFGTPSENHVVLSSNDNALVINPTTSSTTNQIVLYLNTKSKFPSGLDVGAASSFTSNVNIGGNLQVTGSIKGLSTLAITGATTLSNTLSVTGATSLANTLTVSKATTLNGGLIVSGRPYGSGDDEGIVVTPASNGYAGLALGGATGVRSIFYLKPSSVTHRAVWRYSTDGTTQYEVTHPETNGELIVHTADTAAGSASVPVYIAASGVATAITCLEASKGGTGNTNLVSGRLVYTEAYNGSVRMTSGGNHYANATKVSINSTTAPAGAFHVQGDTSINGAITVDSKVKFVYNSTDESLDFIFI